MNCREELLKLQALVQAQDKSAQLLRSELQAVKQQFRDSEARLELARRRTNTASAIHQPDPRVAALEDAAQNAQRRIADLEQSLSWRLTAPLRTFGRTFAGR